MLQAELFVRKWQGDPEAREQLILNHRSLAQYLAKKFAGKGEPFEDLVQVAIIGLINAIDRFDPTRGIKFSTFATPTIVGTIKRHFRDCGWFIKVPRRLQELNLGIPRATQRLFRQLGRSPTISEIAKELNASSDEVIEAMGIGNAWQPKSFNEPVSEENAEFAYLEDAIGDIDPSIGRVEQNDQIQAALRTLPEKQRTVIELRFFKGLPQIQVAARLGCSQMYISRLEKRALDRLRRLLCENQTG